MKVIQASDTLSIVEFETVDETRGAEAANILRILACLSSTVPLSFSVDSRNACRRALNYYLRALPNAPLSVSGTNPK